MERADGGLTGVARTFRSDEIIVSKTDLEGRILYANDVFLRVSGFSEAELLGQPHSLVRHPAMPRCVFKLLWETIGSGKEAFAYMLNRAKNGDEYWVFAHMTPSFDVTGKIVGYHSSRRLPKLEAVETMAGFYAKMLAEEKRYADRRQGMGASTHMMMELFGNVGKPYDEFVFSL
jgi:PAS domain S-box-containing protein